MTELDLKKHMTAVLMPVAPEDWLIDRCCDVAAMYANSLNLKTTNVEKQLSTESHSDQVIDLMNKNAYEDIERLANLEFQDVADEGLFPNHSDKDIWINGFVSAYVYFKNQNDAKTESDYPAANQLNSDANQILNFKWRKGVKQVSPAHSMINNWVFTEDTEQEAMLAHCMAAVAKKSGMTANDLQHIFPAVLRMLKNDSACSK